MNAVTLVGCISQHAQGRTSSGGPYGLLFTVSVSNHMRTGNGEADRPLFFECIAVGRKAEKLEPLLRRGVLVAVRGEFVSDSVANDKIVRVEDVDVLDAS